MLTLTRHKKIDNRKLSAIEIDGNQKNTNLTVTLISPTMAEMPQAALQNGHWQMTPVWPTGINGVDLWWPIIVLTR